MGATPGKRLLGLKVVACDSVQEKGNRQVLVAPAGGVGPRNAFNLYLLIVHCISLAFFPIVLPIFSHSPPNLTINHVIKEVPDICINNKRRLDESFQCFCREVVEKRIIEGGEIFRLTKLRDLFVATVPDIEGFTLEDYKTNQTISVLLRILAS